MLEKGAGVMGAFGEGSRCAKQVLTVHQKVPSQCKEPTGCPGASLVGLIHGRLPPPASVYSLQRIEHIWNGSEVGAADSVIDGMKSV